MFTAFSDDQALLDSVMSGAAGYVPRQLRGSDLAAAVRVAAFGRSLLAPRAASELIARLQDASGKYDPLARLTPHERDVLLLIGEGLTNRQIGERLLIAEKTVKNYVSTLFRKLALSSAPPPPRWPSLRRSHGRIGPGDEDHRPEAFEPAVVI
jgi:two-component system, NarL family, response regulator DevR